MQNTVTYMTGGLGPSSDKIESAVKNTKTRANVTVVYTLSETWSQNAQLHIPIVQLRAPVYAEIVSARTKTGIMVGPSVFTVGALSKDASTGVSSVSLTKTEVEPAMEAGSVVSIRVFAK